MKKSVVAMMIAVLAIGVLGTSGVASAKQGEVRRTGTCSDGSTWKLKLSPDNGKIEADFEVDQNVVGDTWKVVMRHNGAVFFRGKRVTESPSGSFDVSRRVNDANGSDSFVAKAVNPSTGEICKGTGTF
jgi:hypothetical protein